MSRITSSSKGDREEEGRRRMGDFLQRLSVCFLCSWPSFEILSKLFTDVNLETFPVILTFIYLLITPGKFISAHPTSQMTLQPSSYPDEGQSAPLASNSLSLSRPFAPNCLRRLPSFPFHPLKWSDIVFSRLPLLWRGYSRVLNEINHK